MGSYLTIVNNTRDTWQCKVGPDMAAIKMSSVAFGVIGTALAVLSITGAALSVITIASIPLAALSGLGIALAQPVLALALDLVGLLGVSTTAIIDGILVVEGLPIVALAAGTGLAAVSVVSTATAGAATVGAFGAGVAGMASVTPFGIAVLEVIKDKLNNKGYNTIPAGGRLRYGKMTLSLWQQSVCMRPTTTGPYVVVDTLIMRPIFSGSTINSNRDHDIQCWINKHGITSKYIIEGKPGNKTRMLERYN